MTNYAKIYKLFKDFEDRIHARFDRLDERLDRLNENIGSLEGHVSSLENQINKDFRSLSEMQQETLKVLQRNNEMIHLLVKRD